MTEDVDPISIYRGPPSRDLVRNIHWHTDVDSEGRRYWRKNDGSRRRLRSNEDLRQLNAVIDKYRREP